MRTAILLTLLAAAWLRGAASTPTCEADSIRAAIMEQEMALNAPGSPAADFGMTMPDGTTHRLSEWRGKPLLLVLFDPECDDCLHALRTLAESKPDTLPALAVYAEGDESVWPRAMAAAPEGWAVAFDADGVYSMGIYSPEFTPGIYLLDSDGRVVSRTSSPSQLHVEY